MKRATKNGLIVGTGCILVLAVTGVAVAFLMWASEVMHILSW